MFVQGNSRNRAVIYKKQTPTAWRAVYSHRNDERLAAVVKMALAMIVAALATKAAAAGRGHLMAARNHLANFSVNCW